MPEPSDIELLDEFALRNSQEAFATLVRRHVNLVYAVALRNTGDCHKAEDVTQAVFVILARKAGQINRRTVLTGWLYQTARLTSRNLVRHEMRRQRHEQEAIMQSLTDHSHHEPVWARLAPVLDEALERLGEKERNAILLRFFEGRTVPEAAAALAVNESALKARVSRGLERMRKFFAKHGVALSATVLAGVLAANPAQAAPAALISSATALGAAKGTTATTSTTTLIKMTMKTMKWIKIKAVAVAAGLSLAAVTTTTVAVREAFADSAGAGQADAQFKAFLEHPPKFLRAVYEVEDQTRAGRGGAGAAGGVITTNTLKLDGGNYLLGFLSSESSRSIGQFEGTSWMLSAVQFRKMDTNLPPLNVQDLMAMDPQQRRQVMQSRRTSGSRMQDLGRLEMADPKINRSDDTDAQNLINSARRPTVGRLLNLGMEEMVPGTIVWDHDNHGFTARYAFPTNQPPAAAARTQAETVARLNGALPPSSGKLSARLEYENGLPVKATVHIDPTHFFTITYTYRPDFCDGQFPAELTRADGVGTIEFTLRLQELEISNQPLPKDELDPREVFQDTFPLLTTIIHSNGVPYELKDGRLQKPQTPEEYSNMIEDMRAKGLIHAYDGEPGAGTNAPPSQK